MSTVPKAGDPPPANNAKTLTLSGSAGMYGRPASGGPPVPGKSEGNAPTADAPPGPIPGSGAYMPPSPAPVTTGGTDIGHGATIVVGQPDATGHPVGDTSGGGTVGDSGNQGAPPASTDLDAAADAANPSSG